VAHVNAQSFNPGDSVLFQRTCVWYGTSLTIPSGGSSGSPVTFGAYGTGANPILKGSAVESNSGFTLAPNQIATVFSLNDSGTSSTDSGTRNWREQISHTQITNSVISLTVTVKASSTVALNITGSAIGPVTTAPNTSSMTRVTWGGGNNGTTVAAGTTATSDVITYSLNNSVDQIVSIYTTARNVEYYGNNNTTLWSDATASDQSQTANVTGDGFATGGNSVVGSIVGTIQTVVTYRSALGTAPVAVWENGALLLSKNSQSAVEAAAGSWWYDGTYLYLHASDGSNVATNGKTYTYVTASSPSYTAWDNGKSWLIIDSLDQAETYNTSTATLGGLYITGSNSIVRNLSAHDMYRHPLTVYIGATNNLVRHVAAGDLRTGHHGQPGAEFDVLQRYFALLGVSPGRRVERDRRARRLDEQHGGQLSDLQHRAHRRRLRNHGGGFGDGGDVLSQFCLRHIRVSRGCGQRRRQRPGHRRVDHSLGQPHRYFCGKQCRDSPYRERGKHYLRQHRVWAVEHACGREPDVHLHWGAREEQYFLYRGVRERGFDFGVRDGLRLQRLLLGHGLPFQLGRNGAFICELADDVFSGRAFADLESTVDERGCAFFGRKLCAGVRISGDSFRRESWFHLSEWAGAGVFVAGERFVHQSECGRERVGDRRVRVPGGGHIDAIAERVLRLSGVLPGRGVKVKFKC
jgi:hypothetical protein